MFRGYTVLLHAEVKRQIGYVFEALPFYQGMQELFSIFSCGILSGYFGDRIDELI